MTVLVENPGYNLSLPQRVLPPREADPRTSEQSRYVEDLNKYILDSLAELREGQVKALNSRFAPLDRQLDSLSELHKGWDGYDAPSPTPQALSEARAVLGRLQRTLVTPQRVSAAADGGVAFSFKASGNRRAQIEVLNTGEKFAHLYDLKGNSYTLDWPKDIDEEAFEELVEPILNYMQS